MRLGRIDCMSFGQTCCSPVTALAIVRNYWKLAANVKAACKDDGGGHGLRPSRFAAKEASVLVACPGCLRGLW